ncbi:MAG: ferrous iron transporter B [Deltaproteobacteria bacterium]|nr:ferrous iron transporter B [Deltaproteobacteria bacterium]
MLINQLMNMPTGSPQIKKVMLVGLPNTGKSQVYNNLTGDYSVVANSPLTTLETKRARCRLAEQSYEVIDSPGLHSLYNPSEEELTVRDLILSEEIDILVQCMDACRLKQSLTLTAHLLTLGIPMVISLNSMDEIARKGISIDPVALSRLLGVQVVASVAVQGQGTEELKEAISRVEAGGPEIIPCGEKIEGWLAELGSKLPVEAPYKRAISLLVLLDDPLILDYVNKMYGPAAVNDLQQQVKLIKGNLRFNIGQVINQQRSRWLDRVAEEVTHRTKPQSHGFAQEFARLSRHPVFGIPILLVFLYSMFYVVVNVANVISEWMSDVLWMPVEAKISGLIPLGFWHDFLIGDYGILSMGLANALMTVLPILSVFFLVFNIIEDIGYLPNLSVLTKRLLGKLGLSGSAIIPLVLGFGCKTVATLSTKTLKSKKEKYIAVYLIAFAIPCAAQMGLNMSILGRIGLSAFVIVFSVLFVVEILVGMALNKILTKQGQGLVFIQELTAIRLPNLKGVLKKTYYRIYWFLKESLPVFLGAALALFVIDKLGVLTATKRLLNPLIEGFLGLPSAMTDAIILCLVRHEAAAGVMINLVKKGQLDYIQCIVAVTVTTMVVPCFANIMAMAKEVGGKQTLVMIILIVMSSFAIGGALRWTLVALL